MRAEDADALLHVFADPRVMASFGDAPFDRRQMERWVRRNLDHQARHGYGLFSVVLRANGLLIGDCGLERMEDVGGAPETELGYELGYDLRSDHWNRGLATEAAAAVRDHAFRTLGLPRLIGLIRPGNAASRRVAEKVGLRFVEATVRDGRDYRLYARSRAELDRPRPA
jgi:RimJ/RimL family protein N-acetyltransferase